MSAFDRNVDVFHDLAFQATIKTIEETPTGDRLASLARRMGRLADKLIAQAQQDSRETVACKAGCSHCCYQQVLATVPEVLAVADHIMETWTADQIDDLKKRMEAYIPAARAFAKGEASSPSPKACPLLQDDRCSVWEARPLVCRGYNSLDVTACRGFQRDRTTPVPHLDAQMISADALKEGIKLGLKRTNQQPKQCELMLGLEIAFNTPDAGTRFAEGDSLFEPASPVGVD